MNKSVADRLRDSDAVRGLVEERSVAARLRELGWQVVHAAYYDDPETSKLRELDVHAHQSFRDPTGHGILTINLIVEVKTMHGYHIVLAEDHSTERTFSERAWLGDHTQSLLEAAANAGLSRDKVTDLSVLIESALRSEHGESALEGLCIAPPEAPFVGGAFRETNIGSEKELDASVMWRGTQVVFSAISSLKAKVIRWEVADIVKGASLATYHPELETMLRVALPARMRHLHIYHPILVTNARIWKCVHESVTEVPWARWIRNATSGSAWCDIVGTEAIHQYLASATEHYSERCTESGLTNGGAA